MVTLTVILILTSLLLLIPVSRGYMKHKGLPHVDTMAGDEGED